MPRALLLAFGLLALPCRAETLFRDDFSGPAGARPSTHWQSEVYDQGSGRFLPSATLDGAGHVVLAVSGGSGRRFAQQNLVLDRAFLPEPGQVLTFRARLAMPHGQTGIVHAFFLYSQRRAKDGTLRSDEIDFEWLTRQTAGAGDAPALLSVWSDWNNDDPDFGQFIKDPLHGSHLAGLARSGGAVTDQRVWSMDWSRDRVAWYVEDAAGRHLLAERREMGAVPQRPMQLYFNSWVPDAGWVEAFDPAFRHNRPGQWPLLVDWVEVTAGAE